MILEGIVTTLNPDGTTNISPMGPIVDETMKQLVLRPYQTSTTFQNLKRSGQGIFHVTDDVVLLAQTAIGAPDPMPRLTPAAAFEGQILADACRWYAFRVRSLDDSRERSEIVADVVERGSLRDFFGFNRAKHAVLEAAILATRVALLPAGEIQDQFEKLEVLVKKTGGPQEHRAFALLNDHVRRSLAGAEKRAASSL